MALAPAIRAVTSTDAKDFTAKGAARPYPRFPANSTRYPDRNTAFPAPVGWAAVARFSARRVPVLVRSRPPARGDRRAPQGPRRHRAPKDLNGWRRRAPVQGSASRRVGRRSVSTLEGGSTCVVSFTFQLFKLLTDTSGAGDRKMPSRTGEPLAPR